jgi:putative Ca2+/H+ antiporter (TMEM165/GDT1 family)
MDIKLLFSTFVLIFVAELGDKTQIATFLRAAESTDRMAVFIGSAAALVAASLMAVVFGSSFSRILPSNYLKPIAGGLFILLGVWMLLPHGGK